MRYDLGRFRRPMRRSTEGQLMSLISLGDGSTLSLDFTAMSSLDSRFTFSRTSTATFINSSGLVKYADHNLFLNTVWTSTTAPTGWLQVSLGGGQDGTFTYNGDGSISFSTGSSQRCLFQPSPAITVANGLTYTIGFEVVSVSGGTTISECLTNNLVTDSFYRNGVSVAGSTVVQAGDILQTVFTTNATSIAPRMGLGMGGAVSNKSIRIRTPQMNAGNTAAATLGYIANSSTTAAYHAPRFDHDPTTLAPRGLLIEGSVTNLLKYSSYADTLWIAYGGYTKSYTTGITSPSGDTSAVKVTFNAVGNGLYTNNTQMGYTNTVGTTYTFSAWIRATPSTTNPKIRFGDSAVATGPDIPISTTWTRYTYQYTAVANSGPLIQSASGTATGEFEMWGMQLETGSGASSYIPTGSSTVQRAADLCQMTGTNFSSWFQAGSAYSMLYRYSLNSPTAFAGTNIDRACGQMSVNGSGNRTFINAAYRVASGSGDIGRFVRVYDTGSLDITPATLPAAATNTALAFAVNTNDAAIYAKNQIVGTDSSCTILTGQNLIDIGSIGSSQHLNGCISLIKYWPTRLPDATLQSLTA